MKEETVISAVPSDDDDGVILDNPLFNKAFGDDDDPFAKDFEDTNVIPQEKEALENITKFFSLQVNDDDMGEE